MVTDRGLHVVPEQQPALQLAAVHPAQTPASQLAAPQLWQAPPPAPQALLVLPGWQVVPAQHPDGHDAALQTHAPPWQTWPAAHAPPPPHRHAPPVQLSAVRPQSAQAPPIVPHWLKVAWHWSRSQQPLGQLVASHRQTPAWQRWPTPQLAPAPHAHCPPAEQLSARVTSHATQSAPGSAQVPVPAATHVVPEQQPDGQLAALQTHAPAAHTWPAPHAALLPHRHLPALLQASALSGSHATHATPFFPHVERPAIVHVVPEQQPPGQEVASHPPQTPAEQGPPSQLWQAAPPAPQLPLAVPVRQRPVSEQQPAQLALSQTQADPPSAPAAQRSPAAHAGPAPHWQLPPVHALVVTGLQPTQRAPPVPQAAVEAAWQVSPAQHPAHDSASHWQAPPTQCWPGAQAGPKPQAQLPVAAQVSAVTGSQLAHAEPAVPQVPRVRA